MKFANKLHPFGEFIAKRKVLLGMICLIVVGLTVFFGTQQYREYSYANQIGFQEYSPTWLPSGVQITGRKVNVDYNSQLGTTNTSLSLNLNHSPSSYIQEIKAPQKYDKCSYYLNSGQSCKSITTSHGQQYILLTDNIAPINTRDQGIELYKGNVNVYMRFQEYVGQPYSQTTLNRIVDSFVRVRYHRVPGVTSGQCGCGG